MNGLSLRSLLIRNSGVLMIGQAVATVLGLATAFVLSRYLGVEDFGRYNYVFAFYYFFFSVNEFGVSTVVIREVSQDRERAGEIIGSMLLFRMGLAIVSIIAAWLTIYVMGFPRQLALALVVYALILPVLALQLPSVIFQVVLRLEYPSIIGIFNRCIGFGLLMAAVGMGAGIVGLIATLVLSEVISLFTLLKFAARFVRPIRKYDARLWRSVLKSSIPLGITGIFVAVINRVDFIMLERMTDLRQVGLYSAAYKVTNLLEAFPLMVMGTLYPLMSQYAAEDRYRLRALFRTSVLMLGAVAVPIGVAVTLFAPLIIRLLFGASFVGAEHALGVLVWSTVFLYVAIVGGNVLISLGRERINMALNLVGAALNIVLNLWLIPKMGYIGAALATSVTYFFILVGIMTAARLALEAQPTAATRGCQTAGVHTRP